MSSCLNGHDGEHERVEQMDPHYHNLQSPRSGAPNRKSTTTFAALNEHYGAAVIIDCLMMVASSAVEIELIPEHDLSTEERDSCIACNLSLSICYILRWRFLAFCF